VLFDRVSVAATLEIKIMAKRYFHVVGPQRHGPFSGVEIKQRASAGIIHPEHHIQEEGAPKLYEARMVPGLFDIAPGTAVSEAAGSQKASSSVNKPAAVPPHGPSEAPNIRPRFRNPVSALLNSLTSCVLDSLNARVQRGEIKQADFERMGSSLLLELQSAVAFAEAMQSEPHPTTATPNARPTANTAAQPSGSATAAPVLKGQVLPKQAASTVIAGGKAAGGRQPSQHATHATPPYSASPVAASGASALQLGAAALAGGAWGYLLARQGGGAHGMAYGHGAADTHIHYHGDGNNLAAGSEYDLPQADYTPVSHAGSQEADPAVMGVDTNSDGLIDTFYGDTNSDGTADVMGVDIDRDGDIDRVSMDTNHDGAFDRSFVEESAEADDADSPETEDVAEDDYDNDDAEDMDVDDGDVGDFEDVADAEMDFGGDMDFG
jgi:hypothetical protein